MKKRLTMLLWVVSFMVAASLWAEPIRDLFPKSENSHSDDSKLNEKKPSFGEFGGDKSERPIEPIRDAVSVCLVSDFDYKNDLAAGQTVASLAEACNLAGAKRGADLDMNQELKNILSEPVLISEGKLCSKDSLKEPLFKVNPKDEYKKILEKKLVKHCIKLICKKKDLGESCNLAPGAVTVSPGAIDRIVAMYRAELSCKKSDILQFSR